MKIQEYREERDAPHPSRGLPKVFDKPRTKLNMSQTKSIIIMEKDKILEFLTEPQKEFYTLCLQGWKRMDGDELVYLALYVALEEKGQHLNTLISQRDSENFSLWRTVKMQEMKECATLATKIQEWFALQGREDQIPFSRADFHRLMELLPNLWV